MQNPRLDVLQLCCKIEQEGAFSNLLLQDYFRKNAVPQKDKNFIVRLVYGVIQNKLRLDFIIGQFSKIKPARLDNKIRIILRMAIYQSEYMDRVPDYALVNESVQIAKTIECAKYSGFVNGVLRSYLRGRSTIAYPKAILHYLSTYYSYPQWFVKMVRDKYKDKTEWILQQGNTPPPACIRMNSLRTNKAALQIHLQQEGIQVKQSSVLQDCFMLDHGIDYDHSASFAQGLYTPQDTSSMLAARILAPEPGQTVIDMCSAPGGKTTYLAELMQNRGKIIACDLYAHKLRLVQRASERLGITIIETKQQDATRKMEEWKDKADCVLVDAPCSGLGIIRRKPEIKWTKSLEDCRTLAAIQYQILQVAAYYVKPGGVLVYSTCTLTNEENNDIFYRFLREHSQFQAEPFIEFVPKEWKLGAKRGNIQILPGEFNCDGFYIAKMKRIL